MAKEQQGPSPEEMGIKSKKEERAKLLEIPKDVKPGSAKMTWYKLRNAIFLNEETAEANRQLESGNLDVSRLSTMGRADSKASKFIMQQHMLERANEIFSHELLKEKSGTKQGTTPEQVKARIENLTAAEMEELIEKYYVAQYEELLDKGEEVTHFEIPHGDGRIADYPIQDMLRIAHDLKSRLIEEAVANQD